MRARKQMSLKQMETQAKAACFDWNNKHPVGTMVSFEEVVGRGETHRSMTRSPASVMSCEAVIWIEAQSSCVSLDHCTVVEDAQ